MTNFTCQPLFFYLCGELSRMTREFDYGEKNLCDIDITIFLSYYLSLSLRDMMWHYDKDKVKSTGQRGLCILYWITLDNPCNVFKLERLYMVRHRLEFWQNRLFKLNCLRKITRSDDFFCNLDSSKISKTTHIEIHISWTKSGYKLLSYSHMIKSISQNGRLSNTQTTTS